MDVYENAKSFRKDRIKQQLPVGIIRKKTNNQKEHLSHLTDSKMMNDLNVNYWENGRKRQQRHLKKDLFKNNHTVEINKFKIVHENANEIIDEIFSSSNTHFVTDTVATTTTTSTIETTTITTTTATTTNIIDIVSKLTSISAATNPINDIKTFENVNDATTKIQRSKRMVRYSNVIVYLI